METSVWKLSFALQSRASKSIIVFYRSKRVVKDNREYYLTDFQLFFSVLNTVYRIFWPSLCVCVCASAKALSFSVGHQVQGSLRSLLALSISLLFAAYDHLSSLQFPSFVLFVFSVCLCQKNEEKTICDKCGKNICPGYRREFESHKQICASFTFN